VSRATRKEVRLIWYRGENTIRRGVAGPLILAEGGGGGNPNPRTWPIFVFGKKGKNQINGGEKKKSGIGRHRA